MTHHVVIGTAGHVDHGKTALVKALTGTDTDRWAEEKRRGITIDLGFAVLDLGDGLTASIVDVPGHEDFVRNMVAGATGVDVALLVVGADEGIMPQTVEHLAILEFLAVRTGVAAVTKSDLVEPDWLELVHAELAERLQTSPVKWESPVAVSSSTGQGIDELSRALRNACRGVKEHAADDLFRMPVDRVFSVAGAGTVVTGTTWSGSVAVGADVEILPGANRARVRSIEVHGAPRDQAEPGRRTALALAGINRDAVARGSVVVTADEWRESTLLDVMVALLPEGVGRGRTLTQRSRVRLHLGTAEVMARVTPAGEELTAGGSGAARLRLERPIVARWGDRAVIRSYSPVTTIGGCIVADPWPPRRPRRPVHLEDRAAVDPVLRLRAFVERAGKQGLSISDIAVRVGVHPAETQQVVSVVTTDGVVQAGSRLVAQSLVDETQRKILETLAVYHQKRPLQPGMPLELLRKAAGSPEVAQHLLSLLSSADRIVLEGSRARLSDYRPSLSKEQVEWAEAVRGELAAAASHGRTVRELAAVVPADTAGELAEYFVRQGTAIRVGKARYYDRASLHRLRGEIVDEIRRLGRATPADLRARTGLTRKYLIPVLEWLDGEGCTVREGDQRRLGPAAEGA